MKYLVLRGDHYWININNATYGRIRESTGQTDATQAQLVLQKRLGELAVAVMGGNLGNTNKTPPRGCIAAEMTLLQGYEKAMAEHWKINTTYSETVAHNWKGVASAIDTAIPLKSITRSLLSELVAILLSRGDSNPTVNRKLSVVSKVLTLAADKWDILDSVPKFPMLRETKGKRLPLSDKDYRAAITYLALGCGKHDADVAELITVAWNSGARLGELLGLKDSDIDPINDTMSLWKTKNGDARVLPITPELKSILANRSGLGRPFGMLNRSTVDHTWARVRNTLGISPRVTFHSIRHTVVSRLLDANLGVAKVQAFVGHRNINTTMGYHHLASSALRDCCDVLKVLPKK